ncbi:hypothetical protein SAMN04489761_0969 [Tenacibaculum sp. MAR_2009_124]|uniref:DUF6495 family protein n=1 Tax=Tenacibaculum sp. MAR_2009_124 TaxID=1250059 RepID=UPI000896BD6C|nr:DUF6495 family protein [Tenacibaculum sp. MAR_2009_124]SEB48204.1 hypothetical protein SAMN04489761_0969 [Tenacibaculum sp. MAR_2009_124]
MKYRQLTKEQFEGLHEEFAHFLASQSIDAKEWNQIKQDKPHVAEEEMNVFSDVVWDDVLNRTEYLEHFSSNIINLFKSDETRIHRIVIQISNNDINLMEKDGYEWLLKNAQDPSVEILQGNKAYQNERNTEIFDLIEKGSNISKGELFEYFKSLISDS